MSGRPEHSNRIKLAMNTRCPYNEFRRGWHTGGGVGGILDRKGASRTNDGTGAQVNRGLS
jgi:hypothetical protein